MASKSAILSVKILGDAKGAVKAFHETENAASGIGGKIKGAIPAIAGVATVAAGVAIGVGRALYDIGDQFDGMVDTIRTGTGATGDALDGLVDSAKNVASKVPASFEKIAPVLADLNTRTGLTGEGLETLSSQYLEASRILGEDLDISRSTASFAAFNIEGEKMTTALDDVFRVSQATGKGMNELFDILTNNAPVLKELGFSYADSAALIGSLDKAGLDSTKTLSGMNKALVGLAKEGEPLKDVFTRSIDEIKTFIDQGDRAAALDLSGKLFGAKAGTQMLSAIESGKLAWSDLMGTIGATQDTILSVGAETQDAAEKWEILKNRAYIALEPLGSLVFDGIGAAMDYVLGLTESFDLTAFLEAYPWVKDLSDGIVAFGTGLSDVLMPIISQLAPIVLEAFTVIGQYLADWFSVVGEIFSTIGAVMKGDWSAAWEHIKAAAVKGKQLVVNLVSGLWGLVTSYFAQVKTNMTTMWSGAWNAITSLASAGVHAVIGWLSSLPGRAIRALSGVRSTMYSMGQNMIRGAMEGLSSMASALYNRALSIFRDSVNAVKDFLGIHSPSRLFMEIGAYTGQGMALGIESQRKNVNAAYKDLIAPPAPARIDLDLSLTPPHKTPNQGATQIINITVNGALDPEATARQIKDLLERSERRRRPMEVGA